jgi:nitrogen regulatory protein PII
MKKIEAIISPSKLEVVRNAFLEAGIEKMTATEVREYGSQKAHTEIYRTNAFSTDSLNKVKVEAIVPQNKVPMVVTILKTKGQTGKGGDNTINISSVNDVN